MYNAFGYSIAVCSLQFDLYGIKLYTESEIRIHLISMLAYHSSLLCFCYAKHVKYMKRKVKFKLQWSLHYLAIDYLLSKL